MANVMVKVFEYKNRKFTIVKHESGMYMAIDHKYIDEDGRLTKTVRGGHRTIEECITSTMYLVNYEAFKALGLTDMQAAQRTIEMVMREQKVKEANKQ